MAKLCPRGTALDKTVLQGDGLGCFGPRGTYTLDLIPRGPNLARGAREEVYPPGHGGGGVQRPRDQTSLGVVRRGAIFGVTTGRD